MAVINEHQGKNFSIKPQIKIDSDIYDYCKSSGTVNIVSFGVAETRSFKNVLGDVCIVEGGEIPDAEISIPIDPSLISLKYVVDMAKAKTKFKISVTDPLTDTTIQMDEAYFQIPSGVNLDATNAASVTVKGSELYFV
jgi:hypothetical protein